jgi:toxin ParE1/3/4
VKNLPIKITPNARADLDELWDTIAIHSIDSAENFLQKLDSRIRSLSQFPETGVPRPEIHEGLRLLVEGNYLVLYLVRDAIIIILRVVHGARDLARLDLV